jgi:hypothetical protein
MDQVSTPSLGSIYSSLTLNTRDDSQSSAVSTVSSSTDEVAISRKSIVPRPFTTFVSDMLMDWLSYEATMLLYQFPAYGELNQKSGGYGKKYPASVDMEDGFFKTEALAFDVGRRLIERMMVHDMPKIQDHLEMIKFLCKDIWILLYKKQISSLKTNHRGTFVLTDTAFKPFLRFSSNTGIQGNTSRESIPFLALPCGIIRGVLFGLGMTHTSVSAEVTIVPQCTFHVLIKDLPSADGI